MTPTPRILVLTALLLAYEFLAIWLRWPTITRLIRLATKGWPLVPFVAGLLIALWVGRFSSTGEVWTLLSGMIVGGLAVHFWWIQNGINNGSLDKHGRSKP